jgi:poly(hydroxyalkanoate) depolymerase family esterase
VLAPQQVSSNNPNRCFNWFQAEDMRRDAGEPASIAAMIRTMQHSHRLDAGRVFITGLSAGGAMTAVMLAAYPELFAGGAIIAGAPYGTAKDVAQAFQTMQGRGATGPTDLAALLKDAGGDAPLPPLTIWHGEADHVINRANGVEIAQQWAAGQGLGIEPDTVASRAGYVRSVWRDANGDVRIELNQVAGLGHGVPLETRGHGAVGQAAPYMLQAGVSSTLEIAHFWDLRPQDGVTVLEGELLDDEGSVVPPAREPPSTPSGGLGEQVMSAVSGVPANVQAIIADALSKGGLLTRRG